MIEAVLDGKASTQDVALLLATEENRVTNCGGQRIGQAGKHDLQNSLHLHIIIQNTGMALQHARSSCIGVLPQGVTDEQHHQCFVRSCGARYSKDKSAMQRQASRFKKASPTQFRDKRKTENACSPMTSSSHAKALAPFQAIQRLLASSYQFNKLELFHSNLPFSSHFSEISSPAKSIPKV